MPEKYQVNRSTCPQNRLKEEWWKNRWDHKNQELNTSAARAAKLVFIGDSITQAWEDPGKASWDQHFAPLGALNWGYSADRTEHLIWRLQNGDIQRVSPEVAVLLIGTNNTGHEKRAASETLSGIKRSIEELSRKWPKTKIIIMAIFPRGESTEDPLYLELPEKVSADSSPKSCLAPFSR